MALPRQPEQQQPAEPQDAQEPPQQQQPQPLNPVSIQNYRSLVEEYNTPKKIVDLLARAHCIPPQHPCDRES